LIFVKADFPQWPESSLGRGSGIVDAAQAPEHKGLLAMKHAFKAAAALLVVLATASSAQAYDDKDVIDYRQLIMKALDSQTAAFGMIVSTQIPHDHMIAHLENIAVTAKTSLKSFEPKVLGGESKPLVWEQWKDFSERMNTFVAATEKLVETARVNGPEAVMSEMVTALSCKGCHDIYREKK